LSLKDGDLIIFTRPTKSRGDIIPAGVPIILLYRTWDHVVVKYDGKTYRLRNIEDRMKLVTSEMAKVLFNENGG
jgi:hypothetical protein